MVTRRAGTSGVTSVFRRASVRVKPMPFMAASAVSYSSEAAKVTEVSASTSATASSVSRSSSPPGISSSDAKAADTYPARLVSSDFTAPDSAANGSAATQVNSAAS